jgi:hypothetical protein
MSDRIKFIEPSKPFYSKKLVLKDCKKAIDFWRWAYSDLMQNITRGIVGEFIAGWAINTDNIPRQPWDSFDLKTKDGKRIEVKTTAYFQAWAYAKKVLPKFVITPRRSWTESEGLTKTSEFNADIYVLCYFNEKDREKAVPMNLDQWNFWAFSQKEIIELLNGKQSISVKKLEESGIKSLKFNQLKLAINSK